MTMEMENGKWLPHAWITMSAFVGIFEHFQYIKCNLFAFRLFVKYNRCNLVCTSRNSSFSVRKSWLQNRRQNEENPDIKTYFAPKRSDLDWKWRLGSVFEQLANNGRLCGWLVTGLVPGKVFIQTHFLTSHIQTADDLVLIYSYFFRMDQLFCYHTKKTQLHTIPHFFFILCVTYFGNGNVSQY